MEKKLKKEKSAKKIFTKKVTKEVEYLDGWKRCQAEFENYKKSQLNTQRNLAGRAIEDLIFQMLPVLDNFHASIDHIPEDQKDSPWVQGLLYIRKQMEDVFREIGVEELEVKAGDMFDPARHEAIEKGDQKTMNSEQETGDDKQEITGDEKKEKIVKVVQRGYGREDKVLRPARVIVE